MKPSPELKLVLERERAAGGPRPVRWLKHVNIDRDVCKAAVMTTPDGYGMGIAGQLFVADFLRLPSTFQAMAGSRIVTSRTTIASRIG